MGEVEVGDLPSLLLTSHTGFPEMEADINT
jgi:hypothetical protein